MKPLSFTRSSCLILCLCALPTAALAQSSPCLNADEAQSLITYALPTAMQTLGNVCKTSGGDANAFGKTLQDLKAQYQPSADAAWPKAKAAIHKLAPESALLGMFGDNTLKSAAQGQINQMIVNKFDAKDCGVLQRLMTALQPLPANNMASAMEVMIELGLKNVKNGDAAPGLNICPVPAPPAPVLNAAVPLKGKK